MRTIIAAAAITIAGLVGFSPKAEAGLEISIGFGQTYVSGRASCGCPIYTRRICRGYDRCGHPVYSYYRQPFCCGCKKKHSHKKYSSHYKHSKSSKSKYKHGKHYKKGKKCK